MKTIAEVIKEHVVFALWVSRGNKARAAEKLGVSRRSLHRLLARHRIPLKPKTRYRIDLYKQYEMETR